MKNFIVQIKKLKDSEKASVILSNFFSLSFLNAINLIFPLLTIPYLVKVLGVEKYGLLAFAAAVISYFNIVVEYGFNLSATRNLSICRQHHDKVERIYSTVIVAKIALTVICFLVLFLLSTLAEDIRLDAKVYYFTFGVVIGQALMPIWFFQAMEKMKFITIAALFSKLIPTLLIFYFIRSPADYRVVPLLNGVGSIIAGIFSCLLLRYHFKIKFRLPSFSSVFKSLDDGWYVFLSQVKISLFSNTNTVLLGILSGNVAVGYYNSAEKVMRAIAMLGTPLTSALFPYVAREIKTDIHRLAGQLMQIVKYAVGIQSLVIIPVFAFAGPLCNLIFDDLDGNIALTLKVMLIAPIFMMVNNIFGIQIMLGLKEDRKYFQILFIAGIANLGLCSFLAYYFSATGAAISLLLVEAYVAVAMYWSGRKILKKSIDIDFKTGENACPP